MSTPLTISAPELPAPTRRVLVLEHLGQDPARWLTSSEVARAVGGTTASLIKLLRSMELHGQVVSATKWRPESGRPVSLWRLAPPGTVPPPPPALPPDRLAERRRRDRENQRARRARLREEPSPSSLPLALLRGAACADEDPDLFFPATAEDEAKAKACCARCLIRAECYAAARATRQECGVWGGENFELMAATAESEVAL